MYSSVNLHTKAISLLKNPKNTFERIECLIKKAATYKNLGDLDTCLQIIFKMSVKFHLDRKMKKKVGNLILKCIDAEKRQVAMFLMDHPGFKDQFNEFVGEAEGVAVEKSYKNKNGWRV